MTTLARFVTEKQADALPTYQLSWPTNAPLGFKFKRQYNWVWYEYEMVNELQAGFVRSNWKCTPLIVCL